MDAMAVGHWGVGFESQWNPFLDSLSAQTELSPENFYEAYQHAQDQAVAQLFRRKIELHPDPFWLDRCLQHLFTQAIQGSKDQKIVDTLSGLIPYGQMCALIPARTTQTQQLESDQPRTQWLQITPEQLQAFPDTLEEYVPNLLSSSSAQAPTVVPKGTLHYLTSFFCDFCATLIAAYNVTLNRTPPIDRISACMRVATLYLLIEKPIALTRWVISVLASLTPHVWVPYLIVGVALFAMWRGFPQFAAWVRKNTTLGFHELTTDPYVLSKRLVGYEDKVQSVANQLIQRTRNVGTKILLSGITGVGKTAIVYELARRVAANQYPALHGKRIYYFNAANLQVGATSVGYLVVTYSEMMEIIMRDHGEDCILVFDEVHALIDAISCFSGNMADQFLTLLDRLPYCIGITTDPEKLATRYPLMQRFTEIKIQELPDIDNRRVLLQLMDDKFSQVELPVDEKEIERLFNRMIAHARAKFPKLAQPAGALRILNGYMGFLYDQDSASSRQVNEFRAQMQDVELHHLIAGGSLTDATRARVRQGRAVQQQSRGAEQLLAAERTARANVMKWRTWHKEVIRDKQETARQIIHMKGQDSAAWGQLAVQYLLQEFYLQPALECASASITDPIIGLRCTKATFDGYAGDAGDSGIGVGVLGGPFLNS